MAKRKTAEANGQNATECDTFGGVSMAADLAIDALLGGANMTEAALAAGVSRQTLSGWYNNNPIFQAELNRRRHEARAARMIGLSSLIGELENAVRDALHDPETPPSVKLQSALSILPKLYAIMSEQSIGKTDAKEIAQDATRKPPTSSLLEFDEFNGAIDEIAARKLLERSALELETQESA